jgi:hypothetical protein
MNGKFIDGIDTSLTPNWYSEEFMFEFAKWCAQNYYRFTKFWRKLNSTEMGCYTTKELLEEFKKIRNEPK